RPELACEVALAPPRLGDLAPTLSGERQQLKERTVGITELLRGLPHQAQLVVPENAGTSGPFTNQLLRLQAVARRAVQAIVALDDGPIEQAADVDEQIVRLVIRAAIDHCPQHGLDVKRIDIRDRPSTPAIDEFDPQLARENGRSAGRRDVPLYELL